MLDTQPDELHFLLCLHITHYKNKMDITKEEIELYETHIGRGYIASEWLKIFAKAIIWTWIPFIIVSSVILSIAWSKVANAEYANAHAFQAVHNYHING